VLIRESSHCHINQSVTATANCETPRMLGWPLIKSYLSRTFPGKNVCVAVITRACNRVTNVSLGKNRGHGAKSHFHITDTDSSVRKGCVRLMDGGVDHLLGGITRAPRNASDRVLEPVIDLSGRRGRRRGAVIVRHIPILGDRISI